MSTPTRGAAWRDRLLLWGPGAVVGLGAGVVTAHGLFVVATAAGVSAGIAWLYPIITDGLALVAYAATHRLRGGGAMYAWCVVVLSAGLSGLAQAAYLVDGAAVDVSQTTRFGVGAWPALAAALSAHLLYLLGQPTSPVGRLSRGGEAAIAETSAPRGPGGAVTGNVASRTPRGAPDRRVRGAGKVERQEGGATAEQHVHSARDGVGAAVEQGRPP